MNVKVRQYLLVGVTVLVLLILSLSLTLLKHEHLISSPISYQDLTSTVAIVTSLGLLALAIPAYSLLTGSQHVLNRQTEKVIEVLEIMRQTHFMITLIDESGPFRTWRNISESDFTASGKVKSGIDKRGIDMDAEMYMSLKTTQDVDRVDMAIRTVYFPISLNKPFDDLVGNFGIKYIEEYNKALKEGIQVIDTSFQYTTDKLNGDGVVYQLAYSADYRRDLTSLECFMRDWMRGELALRLWLKSHAPDTYKELNVDHEHIFRVYPKIDPR